MVGRYSLGLFLIPQLVLGQPNMFHDSILGAFGPNLLSCPKGTMMIASRF